MSRIAIFLVFAAYFAFRFLPPLSEKNVLVLVETQGLYVDKLSKVLGLKAAFRVFKNFDDSILGEDMKVKIESRVRIACKVVHL